MIFDVICVYAQNDSAKSSTSKPFSYYFINNSYSKLSNNIPNSGIPSNFYTCNLGFFCKEEIKLEKAVKIPVKFRLGSVQYVDWMEGKNEATLVKPVN
ncbi:MAG: hypothetical protein ABI091_17195 [Ferruginibacter sp.]